VALGNPEELWSASRPPSLKLPVDVLELTGGRRRILSQRTPDTIDESHRARLIGRVELFRELRHKTTCAKGGQGGQCVRNL